MKVKTFEVHLKELCEGLRDYKKNGYCEQITENYKTLYITLIYIE